jgi:hypothetical protein
LRTAGAAQRKHGVDGAYWRATLYWVMQPQQSHETAGKGAKEDGGKQKKADAGWLRLSPATRSSVIIIIGRYGYLSSSNRQNKSVDGKVAMEVS